MDGANRGWYVCRVCTARSLMARGWSTLVIEVALRIDIPFLLLES